MLFQGKAIIFVILCNSYKGMCSHYFVYHTLDNLYIFIYINVMLIISGLNDLIHESDHRNKEYPELEGNHKDHQVQLLSMFRCVLCERHLEMPCK